MITVNARVDALDRVVEISHMRNEGLLETLQYMDRNLFEFEAEDRQAFRIAFAEFQK